MGGCCCGTSKMRVYPRDDAQFGEDDNHNVVMLNNFGNKHECRFRVYGMDCGGDCGGECGGEDGRVSMRNTI